MAKIAVLDQSVAELIAAGEVIERPSSIVKEVLENSIDAGADHITVEIRNGGRTFIRVTDNGSGIAGDDMPVAFLRHATSKLKDESDLQQIATLGFRGEALASICAVSEVEMSSKTKDEEFGNILRMKAGQQVLFEQTGCPDGTTLIIRNLFYNVPARLKFLKKDGAETAAVTSVVEKIMLSHPEVSFRYITDGTVKISGGGAGELSDSVYAVFGREFSYALIPVDYAFNGIHIKGLITRPDAGRATRGMQHFYVNNRFVKSKTCAAALEDGYKGTIMVGKFPGCVLNVDMEFSMVDVNVHPAKIEIRFSDEKAVYDAMYFAVKNTLLGYDALQNQMNRTVSLAPAAHEVTGTQVEFDRQNTVAKPNEHKYQNVFGDVSKQDENLQTPPSPPQMEKSVTVKQKKPLHVTLHKEDPLIMSEKTKNEDEIAALIAGNNPFLPESQHQNEDFKQDIVEYPEPMQQVVSTSRQEEPVALQPKEEQYFSIPNENDISEQEFRYVGELFATYVVLESGDKMVLFDKHAAHEKLIYDRLKRQHELGESQLLMVPVAAPTSAEEFSMIFAGRDALEKMGFSFDDFGCHTLLIRAVPAILVDVPPFEPLLETAQKIAMNKQDTTPEFIDELMHSMACKAAIKAHDFSRPDELIHLAKEMLKDDTVRHCPHGRPIIQVISKTELDKKFGRIV